MGDWLRVDSVPRRPGRCPRRTGPRSGEVDRAGGLLGPNGAGKSTLMRMVATLPGTHSRACRMDGAPDHGWSARSDADGLFRFRDRARPADPLWASAHRLRPSVTLYVLRPWRGGRRKSISVRSTSVKLAPLRRRRNDRRRCGTIRPPVPCGPPRGSRQSNQAVSPST